MAAIIPPIEDEALASAAAEGRLPRRVSDDDLTRTRPILKDHGHFPFKLYDLLQYAEESEYAAAISWTRDGRAFAIRDKDTVVEHLLPLYFKQSKFRSFSRQLNLWGFKRLAIDADEQLWAHEHFVRGRADCLRSLKRIKIKGKKKPEAKPREMAAIHSPNAARSSQDGTPSFGLTVEQYTQCSYANPPASDAPYSTVPQRLHQAHPRTSSSYRSRGFHPRGYDTDCPPASDEDMLKLLTSILDESDASTQEEDDLSSILSLDGFEDWLRSL